MRVCRELERREEHRVALDRIFAERAGVERDEVALAGVLCLKSDIGTEDDEEVGYERYIRANERTNLKDLKISFEDDLRREWRDRDIDHLQEQAQMCEEAAHRVVPARVPQRVSITVIKNTIGQKERDMQSDSGEGDKEERRDVLWMIAPIPPRLQPIRKPIQKRTCPPEDDAQLRDVERMISWRTVLDDENQRKKHQVRRLQAKEQEN